MSLSRRLDRIRDDFLAKDVPGHLRSALDAHVQRLIDERAAERALATGARAPEVAFDGIAAARAGVRLQALLAEGPIVLTWFRGSW